MRRPGGIGNDEVGLVAFGHGEDAVQVVVVEADDNVTLTRVDVADEIWVGFVPVKVGNNIVLGNLKENVVFQIQYFSFTLGFLQHLINDPSFAVADEPRRLVPVFLGLHEFPVGRVHKCVVVPCNEEPPVVVRDLMRATLSDGRHARTVLDLKIGLTNFKPGNDNVAVLVVLVLPADDVVTL